MWLIKYNEFFDTLIVCFNNKKNNKTVKKDNITFLYLDDEIVGLNIEKPSIDKNKQYKLYDIELIKIVEKILSNHKLSVSKPVDCFRICKIEECEDIENTILKKCVVNIGNEKIQIITNAKNACKNLTTVVARPGAFLSDGTYIQDGKIKEHLSQGMFCSINTLNIKGKYNPEGIIEANNLSDKIGESFFMNV